MRWLIIGLVVALGWRPAAAAPDRPLRLKFAGDVMFGRYGPRGLVPIAAERRDPFATVRRLLASDLTLVNLETPIARRPPRRIAPPTRNRFAATPARVARLRRAGVDAVTVANNHAEDLGVADTAAVLAALGLAAVGTTTAEEPAVRVESIARAGWTIAIVAVTTVRNRSAIAGQPHLPYLPPDRLAATVAPLVAAARRDHDAVVVAVHWGTEHATAPDPWQIDAAHALIDAGAIAVIGHHPHVLQAIERYQGGVIAYSLGNFLFDSHAPSTRRAGVLSLELAPRGCLATVRFDPTSIQWRPFLRVTPSPHRDRAAILATVRDQAAARATTWTIARTHATTAGACPP